MKFRNHKEVFEATSSNLEAMKILKKKVQEETQKVICFRHAITSTIITGFRAKWVLVHGWACKPG